MNWDVISEGKGREGKEEKGSKQENSSRPTAKGERARWE